MWAMRSPKWKTRLSCVTTITARSGRTATLAQQLHHVCPVSCVEGGGRLVADEQARLVDQRPGDGHSLLLRRRKAGRAGNRLRCAMPSVIQQLLGPSDRLVALPAGDRQRDGGVLGRRQGGQQVVLLEHEADVAAAEDGLGAAAEPGEIVAEHVHLARRSASRMPATSESSVVLPQPLGPTSSVISPLWKSRFTPRRACTRVVPCTNSFVASRQETAMVGEVSITQVLGS